MAKTKSPLLSSSASGTVGKSLIYSKKRAGSITRAMHYPKKVPTLKQWTRRHIVGLLTAHWQCMSDAEHTSWNNLAVSNKSKLPGYHYFLKSAQSDLYTHHGLVGYWSLNESSGDTFFDYSGNSFHGTLGPSYPDNCPSRVSSFKKEYGNALFFDGIVDHGTISHDPKFDVSTQFSVEAWIKLSSLSSANGGIFCRWGYAAGLRCLRLDTVNNKLVVYASVDGNTHSTTLSTTKLTLDWTHVAVTLSPDEDIHLYINSVLDDSSTPSAAINISSVISYVGIVIGGSPFDGIIDELRFYNRALNYNEIKKHYQLLRLDKKRQPLLRL